ncbi:MAG TPA: guanylate kinase [Anaerolineales bacterium]|nr:guanylate kinase [Anaerolineales bacterium]
MDEDLLRRQAAPLLIVISGPSGVGKDAVLGRMKERGLPFHFVVTATTRTRRPNEIDGRDYHFVSADEFQRMIDHGELIEHARVYNDFKGIPRSQVAEALRSGRDVAMRVDVQGAATVRALAPDALLIFLLAASEAELERRLRARRTESPADLALRLETARRELDQVELFDYAVVNRDFALDATVDTIVAIIHAEHHRSRPRVVNL